MYHHGDSFVSVKVSLAIETGQAKQCLLSILGTTSPDQPPWRFGRKKDANEEWQGPYPLESIWNAVRPFIVALEHGVDDAYADLLAKTPAEVDIRRQVPTQSNWTNLRCIGDGQCLEDTPRDTTQYFSNQQSLNVLGGKEDGCEASYTGETGHDSVTITKSFRDPAVDKKTNDLATMGSL